MYAPQSFLVMVSLAQNLRSERNYTDIFPIFQKDFIYWQGESKTDTFFFITFYPHLYNSILAFHDSILDFCNSILALL